MELKNETFWETQRFENCSPAAAALLITQAVCLDDRIAELKVDVSPSRCGPPPGRRSGPPRGCRWRGPSGLRNPWQPGNSQTRSAVPRGGGWWKRAGGGGEVDKGSEVKQARHSHWGMTNPVCTQEHFSTQERRRVGKSLQGSDWRQMCFDVVQ